jgi:hypothetical protein
MSFLEVSQVPLELEITSNIFMTRRKKIIQPFQNTIIGALTTALADGGYEDTELYFDQLTPLVILSQTAEETGKTVDQVAEETNKEMENPDATEDSGEGIIDNNTLQSDTI